MRVLIVEDEKRMAELLKKGLNEENHSATLAYDGSTGLQTAELYEFDAIVLDIMLPGIDGFEVARRLRRNRNQTPILILTQTKACLESEIQLRHTVVDSTGLHIRRNADDSPKTQPVPRMRHASTRADERRVRLGNAQG